MKPPDIFEASIGAVGPVQSDGSTDVRSTGDIVHLPIRRVGDFQLIRESVYAIIGTAEIVSAQIVTIEGPETWCAVLRRDASPDALLFTVQVGDPEGFKRFFVEMLGTIESALRLACLNMDALLNEGENIYG